LTNLSQLKAFRSINPTRDRKAVRRPTANEVFDLLVYGNFDSMRLATSLPKENYVIARRERVDEATALLETNRSLIIDSRLGNGTERAPKILRGK
jgi:hypothetical protein